MRDFGKVAVLMGGESTEREVSLVSGQSVLEALLKEGVDAHPFDFKERSVREFLDEGFSRAFIVLHGGDGENGVVQGLLRSLKIPFTGCSPEASFIGMNKFLSKLVWSEIGLPVPKTIALRNDSDLAAIEEELGLPLFVKPASEGSSVGVVKVSTKGGLKQAWTELSREFKETIIAEEAVMGGEYTVGILGGKALPSIKIEYETEFYDYEAKYNRDDTRFLCPSGLSESEEADLGELALKAFAAIGGSGWGRVDFLRGTDGGFRILEVNTVPGMTGHSLVPKAAKVMGIEFGELCLEILGMAHL